MASPALCLPAQPLRAIPSCDSYMQVRVFPRELRHSFFPEVETAERIGPSGLRRSMTYSSNTEESGGIIASLSDDLKSVGCGSSITNQPASTVAKYSSHLIPVGASISRFWEDDDD